jgi:multicomponent K+:H+ antiporter subunit E
MKRLLPAPLLSTALFALWLLLNRQLAPGHLLLAALLAILVPLVCAPLRPLPVRVRRPGVALRLVGIVARDVVVSNFDVAWGVLRAGRRPPRSAFVITTIVPGTVWSELALDRSAFLLHVFDLDDEAAFVAHFKARYERPLMEIFE